jgi:nicotinamidase-related amidase
MLLSKRSVLVVIDVQGDLAYSMCDKSYLKHIGCAMKVAHLLDVPIIVTEQAPRKIGDTVDEIHKLPVTRTIPKQAFSCCAETLFLKTIQAWDKKQIIVMGIEAHGCVWQTVHDLLQNKYEVYVVVDAVSAHSVLNKDIGIRRCERHGAYLITVEMMATELMRTAKHPKFKEVMVLLINCFRRQKRL